MLYKNSKKQTFLLAINDYIVISCLKYIVRVNYSIITTH
jgi:hypothetical protein